MLENNKYWLHHYNHTLSNTTLFLPPTERVHGQVMEAGVCPHTLGAGADLNFSAVKLAGVSSVCQGACQLVRIYFLVDLRFNLHRPSCFWSLCFYYLGSFSAFLFRFPLNIYWSFSSACSLSFLVFQRCAQAVLFFFLLFLACGVPEAALNRSSACDR